MDPLEELNIPDLTNKQIEELSLVAEETASRYVLSRISSKKLEKLDIFIESKGSKPLDIKIEVTIVLTSQSKNHSAEKLAEKATVNAFKAIEKYLRRIQ